MELLEVSWGEIVITDALCVWICWKKKKKTNILLNEGGKNVKKCKNKVEKEASLKHWLVGWDMKKEKRVDRY